MLMAAQAKEVIGVELVQAAIDDAKNNAERNGIVTCTMTPFSDHV